MKNQLVQLVLPAHYSIALINNDFEDLFIEERADLQEKCADAGVTAGQCIQMCEETSHGRYHGVMTELATFVFRRR